MQYELVVETQPSDEHADRTVDRRPEQVEERQAIVEGGEQNVRKAGVELNEQQAEQVAGLEEVQQLERWLQVRVKAGQRLERVQGVDQKQQDFDRRFRWILEQRKDRVASDGVQNEEVLGRCFAVERQRYHRHDDHHDRLLMHVPAEQKRRERRQNQALDEHQIGLFVRLLLAGQVLGRSLPKHYQGGLDEERNRIRLAISINKLNWTIAQKFQSQITNW